MIKNLFVATVVAGSMVLGLGVNTAMADASEDAIIKNLEDSGKLDAAVERAIMRFAKKQQEAQQKMQEEQQAEVALKAKNVKHVDAKVDHIYGNPNAEVSMIVYSDLECPFCKRFAGNPEKVQKAIGDKVNVVWRHYPLPFHDPMATKEAVASECVAKQAGNDSFWKFINTVLEKTKANGQGMGASDDTIVAVAKESGVKDEAAFKKCLMDTAVQDKIKASLEEGSNSGVQGTPATILLNNKTGAAKLVSGAVPVENLQAEVEAFLAGGQ